jgi:hypothetical protein
LAGETEVLGENLPQRHFCPSQNPTWPDPGLNTGRLCGKPATNGLSYNVAELRTYCIYPWFLVSPEKYILWKLVGRRLDGSTIQASKSIH